MIDALKDNITHNWWTNEAAIDVYGNCEDAASKYSCLSLLLIYNYFCDLCV